MTTQITNETSNKPSEIFRPATESPDWLEKISRVAKESISLLVGMALASPILSRLPSARSILPNSVTWISEAYLAVPFRYFRDALSRTFPPLYTTFKHGLKLKTNWTFIFVGSFLEEVVFRYCIQSLLLTEIPKFVLQRVAPSHQHLIDCNIAKIARIIFTSLLFALVHIVSMGNMPGMLLAQFIAGIYFSYLRECGTSITELSLVHFIVNVINISISGGLLKQPMPSLS